MTTSASPPFLIYLHLVNDSQPLYFLDIMPASVGLILFDFKNLVSSHKRSA